jgi:integrating conjugative element protein (TIGR03761 family)
MSTSVTDQPNSPADDSLDFTSQGLLGDVSGTNILHTPVSSATLTRQQDDRESTQIAEAHFDKAAQVAVVALAGPLRDIEPDTMTLHTRDAYQMFIGRKHVPGTPHVPIVGGRKFAAILKSIWYLSAQDNPYADWILIQLSEGLVGLRERLTSATRQREEVIEKLRSKGLALSVMSSRRPLIMTLGFRSPYGYATAEAMVEFDYYVRVIKTLVHKDRLSDAQGREAIRALAREIRSFFLSAVRWERLLYRKELTALGRNDFLPGADVSAHKRAEAAVGLFGPVPQKIMLRDTVPRHTRLRVQPTEAVLRALQQMAQSRGEDTDQAEEALL